MKFIESEPRYFSGDELAEVVNEAGFKDIGVKVVDYGLCSTPAIFYVGKEHVQRGVDPALIDEFGEVTQAIKEWGSITTRTYN